MAKTRRRKAPQARAARAAAPVAPAARESLGPVTVEEMRAIFFGETPRAVEHLDLAALQGLQALRKHGEVIEQAQSERAQTVATLREQGVSWASIAWAVGMTAEGARKRWGG